MIWILVLSARVTEICIFEDFVGLIDVLKICTIPLVLRLYTISINEERAV